MGDDFDRVYIDLGPPAAGRPDDGHRDSYLRVEEWIAMTGDSKYTIFLDCLSGLPGLLACQAWKDMVGAG